MIAFSLVRQVPTSAWCRTCRENLRDVGVAEYVAVPGSDLLGENIARRFQEGYNTVLMENHGCVTAPRTCSRRPRGLLTPDSPAG